MKTKKAMIDFIAGFDKYPTMNSWNGSYGYSYNVKIHSLPLTQKQKEALYELMSSDDFYEFGINDAMREWEREMKKHGTFTEKRELHVNVSGLCEDAIEEKRKLYERAGWTYDRHGTAIMKLWRNIETAIFSAGFNGRSSGHLVLYKWNGHNWSGTGWTFERDELESMSRSEVKYIYDVVRDFEKLYYTLIETCKQMAAGLKVVDEEYTVAKSRRTIVEK